MLNGGTIVKRRACKATLNLLHERTKDTISLLTSCSIDDVRGKGFGSVRT